MCLKCKEEVTKPLAQVSSIDDDFGIVFELYLLAINIEKEICIALKSFILKINKLYIYIYMKKKILITCYVYARP